MVKLGLFLFYFNEDITEFALLNSTEFVVLPIDLSRETDHTVYFESRGYLLLEESMIPEDCTHIGFITPSVLRKSRRFQSIKQFQRFVHRILQTGVDDSCIIGLGMTCSALPLMYSQHDKAIIVLWNQLLESLDLLQFQNQHFMNAHSNHFFMGKSRAKEFLAWMHRCIECINTWKEPFQTLVYMDSKYKGFLLKDGLIQIRTGHPHYTFHAFLCERLIGLFAKVNQLNIL